MVNVHFLPPSPIGLPVEIKEGKMDGVNFILIRNTRRLVSYENKIDVSTFGGCSGLVGVAIGVNGEVV